MHAAILFKLQDEVEQHWKSKKDLQANFCDKQPWIFWIHGASKCSKPHVDIGGQQATENVNKVLNDEKGAWLTDNNHLRQGLFCISALEQLRNSVLVTDRVGNVAGLEYLWLNSIDLLRVHFQKQLLLLDFLELLAEVMIHVVMRARLHQVFL